MLIIRGLEVTQAIQYYRSAEHLTDPGEQLPDNAVTLIANKSAWVRVYIESDSGQAVANVTGTLTLTWGFLSFKSGQPPLVLNPQPPGNVTAQFNPDYQEHARGDCSDAQFHHSRRPNGRSDHAGSVSIGSQCPRSRDEIGFDFGHAAPNTEATRCDDWLSRPRSEQERPESDNCCTNAFRSLTVSG